MNIRHFREIIERREYVEEISHGEWDAGIEECRKKEIEILSEDVSASIRFLENECTANEYSWISEIIDDLVEKTQSKELVECYKNLMSKFPEECKKYCIAESVAFAESTLRGGGE